MSDSAKDLDSENYSGTVLLVEDDNSLVRLYKDKFTLEGFKVLVARDGETGLQLALSEVVDVLLLDVGLPKMSGLDILKKVREDPDKKDTLTIILTNLALEKERKIAFDLGAKDYLVKAMQTPEQVVNKVREHMASTS